MLVTDIGSVPLRTVAIVDGAAQPAPHHSTIHDLLQKVWRCVRDFWQRCCFWRPTPLRLTAADKELIAAIKHQPYLRPSQDVDLITHRADERHAGRLEGHRCALTDRSEECYLEDDCFGRHLRSFLDDLFNKTVNAVQEQLLVNYRAEVNQFELFLSSVPDKLKPLVEGALFFGMKSLKPFVNELVHQAPAVDGANEFFQLLLAPGYDSVDEHDSQGDEGEAPYRRCARERCRQRLDVLLKASNDALVAGLAGEDLIERCLDWFFACEHSLPLTDSLQRQHVDIKNIKGLLDDMMLEVVVTLLGDKLKATIDHFFQQDELMGGEGAKEPFDLFIDGFITPLVDVLSDQIAFHVAGRIYHMPFPALFDDLVEQLQDHVAMVAQAGRRQRELRAALQQRHKVMEKLSPLDDEEQGALQTLLSDQEFIEGEGGEEFFLQKQHWRDIATDERATATLSALIADGLCCYDAQRPFPSDSDAEGRAFHDMTMQLLQAIFPAQQGEGAGGAPVIDLRPIIRAFRTHEVFAPLFTLGSSFLKYLEKATQQPISDACLEHVDELLPHMDNLLSQCIQMKLMEKVPPLLHKAAETFLDPLCWRHCLSVSVLPKLSRLLLKQMTTRHLVSAAGRPDALAVHLLFATVTADGAAKKLARTKLVDALRERLKGSFLTFDCTENNVTKADLNSAIKEVTDSLEELLELYIDHKRDGDASYQLTEREAALVLRRYFKNDVLEAPGSARWRSLVEDLLFDMAGLGDDTQRRLFDMLLGEGVGAAVGRACNDYRQDHNNVLIPIVQALRDGFCDSAWLRDALFTAKTPTPLEATDVDQALLPEMKKVSALLYDSLALLTPTPLRPLLTMARWNGYDQHKIYAGIDALMGRLFGERVLNLNLLQQEVTAISRHLAQVDMRYE